MEFVISDLKDALKKDLSQTYDVHHSVGNWKLERSGRTIRLILSERDLLDYANRIRGSASEAIGLDDFESVVSLIGVHIVETAAMLPEERTTIVLNRDGFVGV